MKKDNELLQRAETKQIHISMMQNALFVGAAATSFGRERRSMVTCTCE